MHLAFLNPQGNFDPHDSYLTEHTDFGGQLVYVKQVALAMGELGHTVDILTRQVIDPAWPEFAAPLDGYPYADNVRIVRLPAGPPEFLRKELLWPHLILDWVPNIEKFYRRESKFPVVFTTHYGDGGLCAVLIEKKTGIPFTFTGHSLGAQKMDKLGLTHANLAELDAHYHFTHRIMAERLSMNRSALNITSTNQERYEQYGHKAYKKAVDVKDDKRFAVIPPGVNLEIFDQDVSNADEMTTQSQIMAMLERDIDPNRRKYPAIIASGRLDPKKNHIDLIRAYAQSPELQARANLVIFTGGLIDPLRDEMRAASPENQVLLQIREVVQTTHLWGKISAFGLRGQSALAAAYRFFAQRGSVFALTALYEPFGLAPLEAAAAGLPLVVTKNGGPSESLYDAGVEYGVLVDPVSPRDIISALLRLLTNASTWAEFSLRGRQRVRDRYTWERTAAGYMTHLHDIIRNPGKRRPDCLLPIPPYFYTAQKEHDFTLDTLSQVYF